MSHLSYLRRLAALASVAAIALAGGSCGKDNPVQPTPAAALKVLSITPSSGSTVVATPIRVTGTGFRTGAQLFLDGVAAPADVVGPSMMTATAPPHGAGAIDVVVTNPDGRSSRLEQGFTYLALVSRVQISGNTSLTAAGETSPLTVTATYADGTTSDVTPSVRWSVSIPAVAAISSDGILTARALGGAHVSATYSQPGASRSQTVFVTVTPPGTFVASGRVRQPGAGALAGARVTHVATGESAVTDRNGSYSVGGLTDGRLLVTLEGFEPVEPTATPNAFDDVPMQRIVRVAAGAPASSQTLAPNDVEYAVAPGTVCQPCRMIRITSASSGAVRVRVAWADPSLALSLWVDGRAYVPATATEINVDLPIAAGVELIAYIGKVKAPSSGYLPFSISVSPGG